MNRYVEYLTLDIQENQPRHGFSKDARTLSLHSPHQPKAIYPKPTSKKEKPTPFLYSIKPSHLTKLAPHHQVAVCLEPTI
jgi:hypothetical protein